MPSPIQPLQAIEVIPVTEAVSALAWSPSGQSLAIGTHGDQITVAQFKPELKRRLYDAPALGTHALAWLDESRLLAGGGDKTAKAWNTLDGSFTALPLENNRAWVDHLEPSPDRQLFVAAAGPNIWLLDHQLQVVRTYPKQPSTVADVVWHPAGKNFGVVCNGVTNFYRAGSEKAVDELEYPSSLLVAAYHPRGIFFAVGCQDATVHFWKITTGEDSQMSGYPRKIRELAWHPKGRWLAVGGSPEVTLWDFSGPGPQGSTPRQLGAHKDFVNALAFSPDGRWLVSVGEDGFVLVWPGEGVDLPTAGFKLPNPVTHIAWHPEGKQFAVGGETGEVVLLPAP
jgi:WD40 repeat protein